MPSQPVLAVSGARKRFGDTQALDGAALELRPTECLALLGPNGAGKTTLVRSVSGRVALDEGSIRLEGRRLDGTHGAARQDLGVVPQEIALYPLLTARENMRCFGELHRLDHSTLTERIEWALDWTGLADRADSRVRTYSGGMKRRLNIACGVLHRPRIILLDEPTVGVDPQSRHRIWQMLEQLRRNGASLLLTTHQLDEAQQLAERITIIDHGRTITSGTFEDLARRTIGLRRRVTIELRGGPAESIRALGLIVDGNKVHQEVDDVAGELPALLQKLGAVDAQIEDVHIETPTLQAVFLNLTGRELRD